jgi:hypothetical protein
LILVRILGGEKAKLLACGYFEIEANSWRKVRPMLLRAKRFYYCPVQSSSCLLFTLIISLSISFLPKHRSGFREQWKELEASANNSLSSASHFIPRLIKRHWVRHSCKGRHKLDVRRASVASMYPFVRASERR